MRHLFVQVRVLASVSDYALGEVRRQSDSKKGLSQMLDSEMDDHCLLVWAHLVILLDLGIRKSELTVLHA